MKKDKMTDNSIEDLLNQPMDFGCEHSENLPKILKHLNISLAFTSYQAGRLIFIRSDGEKLDINYKSFPRPMGLAITENGITLGAYTQVINFQRVDALVGKLKEPLAKIEDDITAPKIKNAMEEKEQENFMDVLGESDNINQEDIAKKLKQEVIYKEYRESLYQPVDDRVDSCFVTRSSHYTGMINIHDIDWGNEGLWAVNSSFSCLCTLDPDYSFIPRWKPYFISDLVPEDRCHLNGMTLKDGEPAYVTTFSTYDHAGKWRQEGKFDGTLMDVEHNEILLNNLFMPHSPRWHNDKLYYCNSGLGHFCSYNLSTGQQEVVAELQGFTRGVDFYGSIAFVGLSKIRQGNVLSAPPLAEKYSTTYSGISLIDMNNNTEISYIRFTGNVEQIYDVAVVPGCTFPELLEPSHPRMRNHFFIP